MAHANTYRGTKVFENSGGNMHVYLLSESEVKSITGGSANETCPTAMACNGDWDAADFHVKSVACQAGVIVFLDRVMSGRFRINFTVCW